MLRRAVVHGLARINQPWSIETLQRMQVQDDQWAVRNLANQYLEQMAHIDPRVPRKLKAPSESPWLIEFAGKQGMGIPRGGAATEVLLNAYKHGDTEERLAALPYLKRVADDGIIGALKAMAEREDLSARLSDFRFPLVLIHGDQDALIPVERAREIKAAVARANLAELKGVGHLPMLEAVDETARALRNLA